MTLGGSTARDTEPSVPWREITGRPNWMAQRYFDTAHAYICATVTTTLIRYLMALERLAHCLGDGG